MLSSPWDCVRRREQCKCQRGLALCEQGISAPFEDFTEEVGARHVIEHSAIRDFVALLAWASECSQNVVGVQIYGHAEQKEWNS